MTCDISFTSENNGGVNSILLHYFEPLIRAVLNGSP